MKIVPESHRDLLSDNVRAFAFLVTVMADGSPQVTPVWFNTDGETILINSARGRIKDRNMRQRPQVAMAIPDPHNPYRYLQIRGVVESFSEQGGKEHIDMLSRKYTGREFYTSARPGEVRVIYRIRPDRVTVNG